MKLSWFLFYCHASKSIFLIGFKPIFRNPFKSILLLKKIIIIFRKKNESRPLKSDIKVGKSSFLCVWPEWSSNPRRQWGVYLLLESTRTSACWWGSQSSPADRSLWSIIVLFSLSAPWLTPINILNIHFSNFFLFLGCFLNILMIRITCRIHI